MNITLINPPTGLKYNQPPMGLALLAAILEKTGHTVKILDCNIIPSMILKEWAKLAYGSDVIGITATTPTITPALELAYHCRCIFTSKPVIMGGPHVTLFPDETLKNLNVAIVVRGEGDYTICQVVDAIANGQALNHIPGISFRAGGYTVNTPECDTCVNMDSLPIPAYHLLPLKKYKPHPPHGRYSPWLPMITSRGCPYQCAYCSKPVFGSKYRAQSPERVLAEIAFYQQQYGVKEIGFYDDVFTLDINRTLELCETLEWNVKAKVAWTCETRVNLVQRYMLAKMKNAGCYAIAYGIESGCNDILDALNKKQTIEQAEQAVAWTREAGIDTIGYFMIGAPNETPDTINQTIEFAKKLKLDYAQFSIVVPFPGTKLHEEYIALKGNLDIPWRNYVYATTDRLLTPIFTNSQLSRLDLDKWIRKAYMEFYIRWGYLWQRISKVRSFNDLWLNAKGLNMLLKA